MNNFRRQIGRERDQQADQNLATDILAPAFADEALHHIDRQADHNTDRQTGQCQPRKRAHRTGQRESPSGGGDYGNAHTGQARGIVQKAFTLKNMHQPLGHRTASGNG